MPLQTAERLALQHQRDLATIAGATTSVVASVALGADPATISTWYFGVVDGLLARIQAGHAQARLSSTQFLAKHAAMNGVDLTPVPASLNMERARTSLRVTGPVAFQTAMRAGQDEEQAIRSMATQMAGSSQRLVMAGDRDTFEQTLNAGKGIIGWRRRLAGKSCGFCAMLASRGAVYETRKSATQAKDGLAFHDHCNCWAEPMYKHETEPPEVQLLQRQWRNVTAGKRGDAAGRAWRQHWEENVTPVERERLGMAAAKAAPSPIPGPPTPTPGVVVRSALDSRKTLSGLERAWTAEARRITGRDLDVVIPPGTSLQTAKEYAEGVLRGMERFPDSALRRVRFGQMAGDHYAEAGGIDIEFNERWATIPNRPGLQQGIARDIEGWAQGVNGWGARGGGSTLAVALHEFGHIVDINDLGKRGATLGVIARHAAREGIGPDELVARDISVYATTHPKELVAEAFMDVMLRGQAASPAAREIFDLLEAEYFRAGGRITPSFGTFPAKAAPRAGFDARLRAARKGTAATAQTKYRFSGNAQQNADLFPDRIERVAVMDAFAGYRGIGSKRINEKLRAGTPEADARIALMDAAFERSPLAQDIVVYRGARGAEFGPRDSWPDDLTGREWTDLAYTSTSADPTKARPFASDGVMLRIVAPEGTPAVGIRPALRIEAREAEILFGRGQTFRVVHDHGATPPPELAGAAVDPARAAVRRFLDVEIVPAGAPLATAAPVANLAKMTVADLRALAKERGVTLPPKALKADIVRALEEGPSANSVPLAGQAALDAAPASLEFVDGHWIAAGSRASGDALVRYSGAAFDVNRQMRLGKFEAGTKSIVRDIDRVMTRSRLSDDVIVWRGFPVEKQSPFGASWPKGDLTGREWTDAGFSSTTVSEDIAKTLFGREGVVLRVSVPRGTGGVRLSGLHGGTGRIGRGEGEVLLERDLRYRVVADRGVRDGVRMLDVEIVPIAKPPIVATTPNLSKLKVADLRTMAAERQIPIPAKATKADLVRLVQSTPDEIKALQQKAIRDAARERNRLIESGTGTARLLAEVDELISKGASKATILQRLDPKLTAPDQVFAGADAEIVKALRVAVETGDAAKLRTALTRAGTKAKVKPISKAGAKTKFDPATMEAVAGEIADGAQVVVVTRGSTLTLPDGSTMQLTKAKVTAVGKPVPPVDPALAGLPRISGKTPAVAANAKATNPKFGSTNTGPTYRDAGRAGERWTPDMGPVPSGAYEENCTNAIHAFELRMRGYDVEAGPLDVLDKYGHSAGRTFAELDELITDAWRLPGGAAHGRSFSGQSWRTFAEVDVEIEAWPEGARGFIFVGKHIFNVTKVRGKAVYIEAQFDANATRNVTALYRRKYGAGEQAKVIRVDDLVPTADILQTVAR